MPTTLKRDERIALAKKFWSQMEKLIEQNDPPVQALDKPLRAFGLTKADEAEKKQWGKVVRDVAAEHGYEAAEDKRCPTGCVFTQGKLYVKV